MRANSASNETSRSSRRNSDEQAQRRRAADHGDDREVAVRDREQLAAQEARHLQVAGRVERDEEERRRGRDREQRADPPLDRRARAARCRPRAGRARRTSRRASRRAPASARCRRSPCTWWVAKKTTAMPAAPACGSATPSSTILRSADVDAEHRAQHADDPAAERPRCGTGSPGENSSITTRSPRATRRPRRSTARSTAPRAASAWCVTIQIASPRSRAQLAQHVEDRLLGRVVDARGRLVEQQELRLGRERARDQHALALAARELRVAHAREPVASQASSAARARARSRAPSRRQNGTSP